MNYNRIILAGNLTRDPELKYLQNNAAVCSFGMAINRKVKDKPDEVCFIDAGAFGQTADLIAKHFTKGMPIHIEGRLRFREWVGRDEKRHSKHEVVVDGFQFVGKRLDKPMQTQNDVCPEPNGVGPPINDDPDIPF